jgi:AcrR family transcriptional regulator
MATAATELPEGTPRKRAAILRAALELFAERGFHGTAVPAIAKQAGVGAGTVYRYFESKEAIVNALYQHWKQELGTRIVSQVRLSQPPREQFHVYWQGMAAFARENPLVYQFLELHHHGPYLDETSRQLEGTYVEMARQSFVNFRKQQVVKDVQPDVLMAIVHGAFVGLIKVCTGADLLASKEAVDVAEQCVWEAIRR